MKVIFKNMVQAYSGKCDGLVYYYNRRFNRVVVRSLPKRDITAQNNRFSDISRNLKALELSAGYRQNLRDYTDLYLNCRTYRDKPVSNWYNLFMRLMWKMAESLPDINLLIITKAEIYDRDLPCICVKSAVDAGLLPKVRGYERLTQTM